ncbi:MAG: DEAD/DEAH box helicase [Solirubrobacteraceae bacterium]
MDVFALRDRLVKDYRHYAESFLTIKDDRIRDHVAQELDKGLLWPDPALQLNPAFESGGLIDELVDQSVLHPECSKIFRVDKLPGHASVGKPLRLHKHQADAIRAAATGGNYVLTTGTGSGKSLSYIVPIVDHVLRARQAEGSGATRRIRAIVVYPMNALANSQQDELRKFLANGYPDGKGPVTFRRYTGQESDEEREEIKQHPPDILLTNYVMLEYILTRPYDGPLVRAAQDLSFLVLDELHTYRGRQGSDVALLVRRVRDATNAANLSCVGTSATLAGPGTFAEQRAEVARIATRLFGATVDPGNVIGETLRPATEEVDLNDQTFRQALATRVASGATPSTFEATVSDPLARWIERTLGIAYDHADQRYVRCRPRAITGEQGAAKLLADSTGLDVDLCAARLREALLAGSQVEDTDGFKVFAFRLHQFFSGGSAVAVSLQDEGHRYVSTTGQVFVPGQREQLLMPLVFCRECGQEYVSIRLTENDQGKRIAVPRELNDTAAGDDQIGFFYYSSTERWPDRDDIDAIVQRVPGDWIDPGTGAIKSSRRDKLPRAVGIMTGGEESPSGLQGHFIPAPFLFCLSCGVSYGPRQGDFGKLSSLGAGGRSTSTTILGLTAVRELRHDDDLPDDAKKLLSFSDNRQDASLQSGHFNDFVEVGLLRSALYRALAAEPKGVRHDQLAQAVFAEAKLSPAAYASEPELKGPARTQTDEALREVLAYRVYRDQERGWRLTSPNLEQTGLLRIEYDGLAECCADEAEWNRELPAWIDPDGELDNRDPHSALVNATPQEREKVAKTLLDYMRRELAIGVAVLQRDTQERLKERSSRLLTGVWAIDEFERLAYAATLYPRSRVPDDPRGDVYLSPRGGFGQYLARHGTFSAQHDRLKLADRTRIIAGLLNALRVYGLIEQVHDPSKDQPVPGFRVQAAQMVWHAGDGKYGFHDPIRVPQPPKHGKRTNEFFLDLYRDVAQDGQGIEAREHTAQVMAEVRERREHEFKEGKLPVLFCSPTMELGVDIASLNVVNMRNVPPTPANYAQRSGRAGRSGQPALVYTFCSALNNHDQYFFRRSERMVSGQVAPPQLDLANEDLVRAHVHSIWLAETGADLGSSLTDILNADGDHPSLELRDSIATAIYSEHPRERARSRAAQALSSIRTDLAQIDWWTPTWLDSVINAAAAELNKACDRWRGLFRSAQATIDIQTAIIKDASRSEPDKKAAIRIRREAETQLTLLAATGQRLSQSDFYVYRYLASEGFLPGYNFPRLPLSAYIPGAGARRDSRDEYVQRPRFLAITEFGPRAIIYHEGSQYEVDSVILPVPEPGEEHTLATARAKLCDRCGQLHEIDQGGGPDLCVRCGTILPPPLEGLLRLQNVKARRRERISSDEEERRRQGYEVRTAVRFAELEGRSSGRAARVDGSDGAQLASLFYGHAATVWRVNYGWRRRKDKQLLGFVLDTEKGRWQKQDQLAGDQDVIDPGDDIKAKAARRVIPFVEDHRNCLIFHPALDFDESEMASLQAALKRGIQAVFQLEDQELAAEPLPSEQLRSEILLYESAEGGAGVLRRLLDDPAALAHVAREALDICHFDPDSGDDLGHAPGVSERCEAACYDCLLSYGNQRDHLQLDRLKVKDTLLALARCTVRASATSAPPDEQLHTLMQRADSDLERKFLGLLTTQQRRLPSTSQELIADAHCRPDFLYKDQWVAVFIDGPPHDQPGQQQEDHDADARLEDLGWTVIRLRYDDDWPAVLDQHAYVFGAATAGATG